MNVIALLWLLGALAFRSSAGNEARSDEPVDAVKAVESLPQAIILAATQSWTIMECLTADRTAFDPSAGTATYIWHVKDQDGQPRNISVEYTVSEESPDSATGYINFGVPIPITVQAVYADYKSCVIEKVSSGPQEVCIQWVTPGTENNVPDECNAAMQEKCGDSVLLYTDDVCK